MTVDFEIIQNYWPLYQEALVLTLKIGWCGILFAVLIGFVCALIQYRKTPVLRQVASVYVEISRNTPLLIQLFFMYYKRRELWCVWFGVLRRQLHG